MSSDTDKVHLVHVHGQSAGESYLLSNTSRDEFMGVACIKGIYRTLASKQHWMGGRVMYIPLDKVLLVTEYDSLDAYRDAIKRHYEEKGM